MAPLTVGFGFGHRALSTKTANGVCHVPNTGPRHTPLTEQSLNCQSTNPDSTAPARHPKVLWPAVSPYRQKWMFSSGIEMQRPDEFHVIPAFAAGADAIDAPNTAAIIAKPTKIFFITPHTLF